MTFINVIFSPWFTIFKVLINRTTKHLTKIYRRSQLCIPIIHHYSILPYFISFPFLSYSLRLPVGRDDNVIRTTDVRWRLLRAAASKASICAGRKRWLIAFKAEIFFIRICHYFCSSKSNGRTILKRESSVFRPHSRLTFSNCRKAHLRISCYGI